MTRSRIIAGAISALLALGGVATARASSPLVPSGMTVERIVMLYRHGLRAPLDEEIGARSYAPQPWPVWSTAPSLVTPHGAEAMRQLGLFDRAWFTQLGLTSAAGCPSDGQVSLWTNTEARTISSGADLAEGLAPGCQLKVGHLPPGQKDPLFEASAAVPAFDAAAAVQVIDTETGGPAALIAPHAAAVHTLETILGCRAPGQATPCDIGAVPSTLEASANGKGLRLRGPIDITSGTAEVFILEYGEGMPLAQVGWGRATPARLSEVSRLHALLFDIFDRSSVMAHRTAGAMAPKILALLLQDNAPPVSILVGHDNNIAALASLLGAHFQVPGYGLDDPPLGGALGFAVLRETRTGARFVRVFYQAQTLDQLRSLTPLSLADPPAILTLKPRCSTGSGDLCELDAFRKTLEW
jgi:4-phytase/acid phosphatase